MRKKDDLARLTSLNSLLSLLSGGPTRETEQISAVLRFLRSENSLNLLPDDYDANVARIIHLHDPSRNRFSSVIHWDMRSDCVDPLWIRARLLEKLNPLQGITRGLLVISGLRQRLCQPPKKWTKRRASAYRELVSFIEKTATEKTCPSQSLTLLFV